MNNIDRAIEYFKNLKLKYDDYVNKDTDIRLKELDTISRDMFALGLQALEEKAERNKC